MIIWKWVFHLALHSPNIVYKDEIIIYADRSRFYQIICNLLNNAIKFTDEGSITVIVERKDNSNNDEIVVSIKDTGTIIDSEILPKLFTKFATKSTTEGGTGLGLFISKSIIERHGGRIWAINNAAIYGDGKGQLLHSVCLLISNVY
jgi:signal transduction histidine kinase